MSGPESEPTQARESPGQTPWWQQTRRHPPSTPSYSAEPQNPPYQQPVYPQYAQPAAQPADGSAHSNRWLVILAAVLVGAVAAVAVVVGLLAFGAFDRQVVDVAKAQDAIKKVVTDPTTGYGIDNVTDVRCNDGKNPSAKKNDTFTCQVTVDGKKRQLTAVFVDDNGTYEVDRPR